MFIISGDIAMGKTSWDTLCSENAVGNRLLPLGWLMHIMLYIHYTILMFLSALVFAEGVLLHKQQLN